MSAPSSTPAYFLPLALSKVLDIISARSAVKTGIFWENKVRVVERAASIWHDLPVRLNTIWYDASIFDEHTTSPYPQYKSISSADRVLISYY